MKLDQPIGDSSYGPFFIRITLGAYLLMSAMEEAGDIQGYIDYWKNTNILPPDLSPIAAVVLLMSQLLGGLLLFLGMWSILAAFLATLVLGAVLFVDGPFVGPERMLNFNVVLLASAMALLYLGGGAFSIDRFRKSG